MKTLQTLLSLPWIFSLLLLTGGLLPAAQPDEEPFTSKFQNQNPDGEQGPEAIGGKRGPDSSGRGQEMSEEDRARMKTIHEKLSKNPEVQKAREQIQNAQTPEEHQEAMKNMRKVMDKSLGAEDKAFMEKMRKQKPNKKGGRRGPGGQGGEGFEGKQGGPGGQGGQGEPGGQPSRRGQREKGPGGQGEDGFPGVPPEFGGGQQPKGDGPAFGSERGGEPGGGQYPRKGGSEFGDDSRGQRGPGGFGGGGGEQGRPQLTEEQRTRLKSIRAKYKDDPEVKASREAVKEAITPEERELAIDEYRATVRNKLNEEDRKFLDEFRQNRVQQRPTQIPAGGERF